MASKQKKMTDKQIYLSYKKELPHYEEMLRDHADTRKMKEFVEAYEKAHPINYY